MKSVLLSVFFTFILIISTISIDAQISIGLGGSSYAFINSRDNNLHYGGQLRLTRDEDLFMFELDAAYFTTSISSVPTVVKEVGVPDFPINLSIINSVSAYTVMTDLNLMYFFRGQPIDGRGWYGLVGIGGFYYDQTYNLSHFNPTDYYSEQYIDGANYASTQLIWNLGIGGKLPMRKSSWYYEAKFSLLTNPYLDYDRAIQGSHFITISTGIRFHIKTRKSRYQRISLGRTSKQKKKSKKRLRN